VCILLSTGELGVEIIKVDLSDAAAVKGSVSGKSFTHVFDNFAKDTATCTLAEMAKDSWGVKSYTYVSSAGMYKSDVPQPMKEDGSVLLLQNTASLAPSCNQLCTSKV
jgi:hypothetical protein